VKLRRAATRATLCAAILLVLDLACDRLFLADGLFLGRPVAPFDPPLFSPDQRAALERIERELAQAGSTARFDAELGWCNRPESGFGEFRYDWAGARIGAAPLARPKAPGVRRVVAIGCSMTHGEEVGALESWCAVVDAERPDLEVANLGVAAYGLDQALLRLRRDGPALEADEVWLGALPAAALRVTTLYRPLLDHWSLDVAFKPRFTLAEGGALVPVPNPVGRAEDIPRLLHDADAFRSALGDDDPWLRRAPLAYARRGSHWSHRSFAARLLLSAHEAGGRAIEACFGEETEFGRLYTGIVRATAAEARASGARFRLLLLPGERDLEDRRERGRGYWEDWAARRRDEGLRVLDLSQALAASGLPARALFAPRGHYTPAASRIVARAILADDLP
jgi:hypothetical protein